MASTFTDLGLELMATGENAGTWGTKTNANLNLAEQLLGGFKIQTLNAAGSGVNTTALTVADGALTGAAQNRVIILGAVSPEAITGNKIVTVPLLTETFYFIKNCTSFILVCLGRRLNLLLLFLKPKLEIIPCKNLIA